MNLILNLLQIHVNRIIQLLRIRKWWDNLKMHTMTILASALCANEIANNFHICFQNEPNIVLKRPRDDQNKLSMFMRMVLNNCSGKLNLFPPFSTWDFILTANDSNLDWSFIDRGIKKRNSFSCRYLRYSIVKWVPTLFDS